MDSVSLNEARKAHEKLSKIVPFLDDLESAIKFQGYHEEAKGGFTGVLQKLTKERDELKASITDLKKDFTEEKLSMQRTRFAQKTVDDNHKRGVETEISTLLERKAQLEKSHEVRMKATEKEYEDLIAKKKTFLAQEEVALEKARSEREEYKKKAASW